MGVVACAWPIGVYQHVPLTEFSVVSIACGIIVVLWLLDLALDRHARIPFELLWPIVLITVIAMVFRADQASHIVAIAVSFLATLHFARQREDIEHWLRMTAAACLVIAIADLFYRAGYGWPTAYALPSEVGESFRVLDAASATSTSLSSSSIALLTGAGLWAVIAYRAKTFRALSILCFVVMGLAAGLHLAGLMIHFPIHSSHWLSGSWTSWVIGGLGVWLLARIGANVLVDRARKPDGEYAFVAAPILSIAIVMTCSSVDATLWYGWAAALTAGYVIRDKRSAPTVSGGRLGAYAVAALIPYAVMNGYIVDRTSVHDGRNYALDLRNEYASGDSRQAVQRIEFWNQRTGDSGAQDYWGARVALDLDRPAAAAAWAMPLSRGGGTHGGRQPIPTSAEIDSLLNKFRDHVSALPEDRRGIAYERVLSAIGDADTAEMSLRQRIAGTNPVYEDIGRGPLENAATFLFSDIGRQIDFSDWSVAELIAVLNLAGAQAIPAPDEVDRSWLPATVVIRRDARRVWVMAESTVARSGAYDQADNSLMTTPERWPANAWQTAALPFDGSWQITLHTDDESGSPIATVTFSTDGQPEVLLAEPVDESVPDEPTVFIWLP